MIYRKPPTRTKVLRIHRREDDKFETRNDNPTDSPLGVDSDLNQAIGTAVRAATALTKEFRYRVVIECETRQGEFRREQIINPPVQIKRNVIKNPRSRTRGA